MIYTRRRYGFYDLEFLVIFMFYLGMIIQYLLLDDDDDDDELLPTKQLMKYRSIVLQSLLQVPVCTIVQRCRRHDSASSVPSIHNTTALT